MAEKDSKLDLKIDDAFERMGKLVKQMQSEIQNSKNPSGRGKEEIGNNLTLLSVAQLDDDLKQFAKTKGLAKKDLVKKFYPREINLYKEYVRYRKYYYENAVIPTEKEWQSCLHYFKNLVYVMQVNRVCDRQIKTYVKQLKALPDKYDEKFKEAFKDKIKDKAPKWLWEFVVKAPSIINAIAESPNDSLLRQDLREELPSVGTDNLLLVPPKLWLALTVILNKLIVEIKLWSADKVDEAEQAERMQNKNK